MLSICDVDDRGPTFGLSAHDLANGVKLILRTAHALRQSAPRYRHVALDLEILATLIEKVRALQARGRHEDTVRMIRLCASACLQPLQRFLTCIAGYQVYFDKRNADHGHLWLISRIREALWPLEVDKQIRKLKLSIGAELNGIAVMLQLLNIEQRMMQSDDVAKRLTSAKRLLARIDPVKVFVFGDSASNDCTTLLSRLMLRLTQQSDAGTDSTGETDEQTVHGSFTESPPPVDDDLMVLRADSQHLDERTVAGIFKTLIRLESMVSDLQAEIMLQRRAPAVIYTGITANGHVRQHNGNVYGNVSITHYQSALFDRQLIQDATSNMMLVLKPHLQPFLMTLQKSVAEFLIVFAVYLLGLQHLMRTANRLWRGPSMLLEGNIILEDALGRVMSLQFQHFRHWDAVQTRLEVEFANMPGEHFIQQGLFHFETKGSSGSRTISSYEWNNTIRPGARLEMSMRLVKQQLDRACPRCRTKSIYTEGLQAIECPSCGLYYRVLGSIPNGPGDTSKVLDLDNDCESSSAEEDTVWDSCDEYATSDEESIETSEHESHEYHESLSNAPNRQADARESTEHIDDERNSDTSYFKRVHVVEPPFGHIGSLLTILSGEKVSWDRRLSWARQITGGLHNIHMEHRVHRHLTLYDIFVDTNDQARVLELDHGRRLTSDWMPPELVLHDERHSDEGIPITTQTNMWQLGIILWRLAVGEARNELLVRDAPAKDYGNAPLYYREAIEICLRRDQSCRGDTASLLARFAAARGTGTGPQPRESGNC